MSRTRIHVRNLIANWLGYGANLAVVFFLSPFVVRTLGKPLYGVWVLLASLGGYLGLLDMSIRMSLARHVNLYLGVGDITKVNAAISTATAAFLICGLPIFAGTALIVVYLNDIFTTIPAQLIPGAQRAIVVIALTMWFSCLGACFGTVLRASERFDISNGIALCVLGIRAAGTVVLLSTGGRIVALAVIHMLCALVGALAAAIAARGVLPDLRLRVSFVSKEQFRALLGFGLWMFIGRIAIRLLYWTDTLVIGILLGPTMVTFYSIPMMLILHAKGLLGQISGTLEPRTIQVAGRQDYRELRWVFGWGSKIVMFLAIPTFIGLIVFGKEFMTLWMGPDFCVSGPVLILLAIPQFCVYLLGPGASIVNGLGRVRFGAVVSISQAIANLALTLVFVMVFKLGLKGVALGTLIPMIGFNILLATFILRWIAYPARGFVVGNVLRYCVTAGVLALAFYGASMLPAGGGWGLFIVKIVGLAGLSLPVGWFLIFSYHDRKLLRERWAALISPGDRWRSQGCGSACS